MLDPKYDSKHHELVRALDGLVADRAFKMAKTV